MRVFSRPFAGSPAGAGTWAATAAENSNVNVVTVQYRIIGEQRILAIVGKVADDESARVG